MIYRSFAYKHLQKSVNRLGLAPSTTFACINQYLFRPKPPALKLISEYTSVLSLPSVFSVGIHVRTGDRSMKDSEYDKINTGELFLPFLWRRSRVLIQLFASSQTTFAILPLCSRIRRNLLLTFTTSSVLPRDRLSSPQVRRSLSTRCETRHDRYGPSTCTSKEWAC